MRLLIPRILLLLVSILAICADDAPSRTVRSILDLDSATADKALAVRISGVVTCSDAHAGLCFVQDSSGGIYFFGPASLPKFGDAITVAGATGKGLFSPIVHVDSIESQGPGALPRPQKLALEQLPFGRFDAQFIEIEGVVVRSVEDWRQTWLTLAAGNSRLDVRILESDLNLITNWVDSRLRIRGVIGTKPNSLGQTPGITLFVQNTNLITVLDAPPSDPFAIPARTSRSFFTFSPKGFTEHRARVSGAVTAFRDAEGFYLNDGSGPIRVQSHQGVSLSPGDFVDVVGFPGLANGCPLLTEAIYRKTGEGKLPAPREITGAEPNLADADGEVISLQATIIEGPECRDGCSALVLRAGPNTFRAWYQDAWGLDNSNIAGGVARVTGVLARDTGALIGSSKSFVIWTRSAADIVLVSRPPGWRRRQVYLVFGGVSAALLAGACWVALLRRRVQQQTALVRASEASIEERFRDLFENSNDIIYAHDLDGRITSMNNTGQATLGYTLQELTGMTIADLIDPADLEKARVKIKEKVAGQKRTVYELRVRARDGRILVFDVNSRIVMKDGVAVGVQGIARDITQRKNAEEALRLSERQLRTSLEERERLARDLHDGLIQSVYAVGLNVEDCARIAPSDPATVERRLRKAVVDLNHVIRDVRDFIMTLERHRLKGDEFKAALKSLALTAGESQAARIDIAVDDKAAALLNSNEATHLLHIAREALSNAIRHSRAQKISIQLRRGDDGVVFEVADDGIGFNPPACERNGMGLRNMAARAKEINALFRLVSQQGEGARIVLDILRQPQGDLRSENPLAHR